MSAVPAAITGAEAPPAFLIGAGRSGTTLLYKLLCLHPEVAYISNYDKWLPALVSGSLMRRLRPGIADKLGNWFNAEGNAYFVERPMRQRFVATPVEGEFLYERCGVPLFPKADEVLPDAVNRRLRDAFGRIRRDRDARIMLSKRTANNRRLPQLEAAFPQARYVYLTRDGRDVARSLARVEWWADHPIWWDGRAAKDIEATGVPRAHLCVENWLREVEALQASLAHIDPARVLPLKFEALLANPIETLNQILSFLDLPAADGYEGAIAALALDSKTYRPRDWSDLENDALRQRGDALLADLGYAPGAPHSAG